MGWLLLAVGVSLAAAAVADAYARYGLLAQPGAPPAARYVGVYSDASWLAWLTCIGFVLLLTPTGRLPSPRWRGPGWRRWRR